MKNQKGVTMIELVIVLVILLLMTTFAVYTGNESTNQAIVTEVYTEINSMKSAVNGISIKAELNGAPDIDKYIKENEHFDEKVSDIMTKEELYEKYNIDIDTQGEFEKLYLIYGMDEIGMSGDKYNNSFVRKNYGLDSIKHTYLVNFETGKVELLKSLTLSNKPVRTYEQIRALVDDGNI